MLGLARRRRRQDWPEFGLNIAYSFRLGFLQACDLLPLVWSHDATSRAADQGICVPRLSLRARKPAASPPPQDPAQRVKLQGEIANAQHYARHSREASTAFSEACAAFLQIMSKIGANAFEHFRRVALSSAPVSSRCNRDMSLRIRSHCIFRSPDASVPPQWP